MIDHGRFQRLAAVALDFAPSAAEASELDAHLRECAGCRAFAAGIRADGVLARSLPRAHAPDRVRQTVVAAAYRPTKPSRPGRILPAVGAAAVVIVLLAAFGWLVRPRIDGPGQLPGRSFTRIGDMTAFGNGTVADVLGTGAQLIAVGNVSDGGRVAAAVWMSADGLSWQQLPADATFLDSKALNVASHGDTLIVLGTDFWTTPGQGTFAARVWLTQGQRGCKSCTTPPSGIPWQAAGISFPHGADQYPMFAAIADGGPASSSLEREIRDPGNPEVGRAPSSRHPPTGPPGASTTLRVPSLPADRCPASRPIPPASWPSGRRAWHLPCGRP